MSIERISVIGLGKLGLCTASCFASKGYKVIGVDLNKAVIQAVNEGKSPIYETGLDDLIKRARTNLTAISEYGYALKNSEVTFVIVPTPSEEDGGFSTRYVEAAGKEIAKHLADKQDFHVIVIVSTVLPGATENVIKPVLEETSGKKCGVDFGLCYSPEFIALGSVIRDFTNPDVVLIGESDTKAGEILSKIYQRTCENNPPIVRTTFYNAELAKISLNAFVTMKISFANTLTEICEQMPGGNVDVVSKVLGSDSRVGRKYLTGGLGFGGPCFPRDNRAFAHFAGSIGCKTPLAQATDKVNKNQNIRFVKLIRRKLGTLKHKKIAMLGLTYKTDTNVVEESAALGIAKALIQTKCQLSVFDPAGMPNARFALGDEVKYETSIDECLRGAEFCIIATPWKEFRSLRPDDFTRNMKRPAIIDCWRIFDQHQFKGVEYYATGLNLNN